MESKRDMKDQETERVSTVTAVLLKSRTGEFDLESILFLKLRGIYDLGCIGECVNLERLDLSGNNITNLGPLSSLRLLKILNVPANRISNLDGIHSRGNSATGRPTAFIVFVVWTNGEAISSCDSLQSINVAGNLISSIDNIHCLQSLRKLENIRLKDNTYNYTNPVCKNMSYRNILLEMFPNIRVLDGERVVGRGSDLYQLCKDIDETIKAGFYRNGQLPELPDCKTWVDNDFWEIKRSNNAIIDEAYKQFNDVLHECRLLNNRAAHVISQTERSLSLKNQPKQYTV
ncbi:leucine-rich repeat-containing protein 61 isoform X2 [Coregonus clupeaformis]|uniref:leucine-rich repeat-containing protein 61 isoform X2 n=1 Tax=Coregonus clupeaformis TaxID=59861 RepID=UPI001E1C3594|nr:leucine-rich repeat-containing protein 61 isoform X2 [Coregonus clupeaformis]